MEEFLKQRVFNGDVAGNEQVIVAFTIPAHPLLKIPSNVSRALSSNVITIVGDVALKNSILSI